MILITTSRKPSNRTRSFCKDLQKAIPGSVYKTRGKARLQDLLHQERTVYVTESKGNPRTIEIYEKGKRLLHIVITGVKLSREGRRMTEAKIGKLSKLISEKLGTEDNIIKQSNNTLIFQNGLAIRVEEVSEP
jgi:rRNA maturation protein Rpf1